MRGRCYTGIYVASTASRLASVFALLCSRTVKKIMKLRRNPVCNCVALYLPFSFSLCLHVSLSFIKTKQPNQLSSILITTLKSKMPSNKFKCCKEVKDHFIFHKKCVSRSGGNKTGAFLNAHLKDSSPFQPRKLYKVCHNFATILDAKQPFTETPKPSAKKVIEPPVLLSRSDRADRRAKINEELFNSESLNSDTMSFASANVVVEETVVEAEKKSKRTFFNIVSDFATRFHKPFRNLKWRSRVERLDEIAAMIIAASIDKPRFKAEGKTYCVGNEELGHEVLNILNCIKDRLEDKLGVDLRGIQYPTAIELDADDEENDLILKNLAYAILGESTGRGYERIRVKFNEIDPNKQLPSIYMLNKDLPLQIVPIEVAVQTCSACTSTFDEDLLLGTNGTSQFKTEEEAALYFSSLSQGQQDTPDSSELKYIGAKLDGSYLDYINLMMEKHAVKENTVLPSEDIIVINSFDGAEGFKSQKNVASVISFSSSVFSPSMINSRNVDSGSSFNILTWMQVMAKETFPVMKASLELDEYWTTRTALSSGDIALKSHPTSSVSIYDIHDGKMIYSLLQHSQWNRKHHPFLLCKCKKSDGLADEGHSCSMWTNDSYKAAWERSLRRWNHKIGNSPRSEYSDDTHKNWCDEHNFGVTHFGISPATFNVETIKFDVFHCKCAIIRRIMSYTRDLILKQSSASIKAFTNDVLKSFWSNYHIYCWNNNFSFSSFKGNELALFVLHSSKVAEFLEEKYMSTDAISNLIGALRILPPIFKFITTSYIENKEEYEMKMKQYEIHVKDLYRFGKHTFLDHEDVTFYFHCLRFYFPQIAREVYTKHGLGMGIFSMQGFERRNKESKNTLSRFTSMNRTNNYLLVNNLRRLLQVFLNEINAY